MPFQQLLRISVPEVQPLAELSGFCYPPYTLLWLCRQLHQICSYQCQQWLHMALSILILFDYQLSSSVSKTLQPQSPASFPILLATSSQYLFWFCLMFLTLMCWTVQGSALGLFFSTHLLDFSTWCLMGILNIIYPKLSLWYSPSKLDLPTVSSMPFNGHSTLPGCSGEKLGVESDFSKTAE